ncbi:undecaprenyl-phosphate glucose phosphotransferase [bacterium]|nr:undecaprenyl-phosphate glucose phosphotransferase [bacterium]
MLKENARIFLLVQRLADAGVVALAFGLAFFLRFRCTWLVERGIVRAHAGPLPLEDYLVALPVAVIAFLLALEAFSLYEQRRTHGPLREAWTTIQASAIAAVFLLAAAGFSRRYSREFSAGFVVIGPSLLAASRALERAVLRAARRRGWNVRRALVVGEGEIARELVSKLRANTWTGIEVVGALSLESQGENKSTDQEGVPLLGSYHDVQRVAKEKAVDQVLLAVPLERATLLRELRGLLDALPIDVRIVPDTAGFLPIRPAVAELDGLPIVTIRSAPAAGIGAVGKRALDLLGAGTGLVLLSPLFALIALVVRAVEGAPVLYRQERVGWGGRPFVMLKFRTMVADAEAQTGPTRTRRGDERRTRLGTFLRRTSLDELPQLWNVWKGDMSLVGPRPERPEFVADLRAQLPDYMLRLTVKAGMTGLAQVHGLRGDSCLAERLRFDLDYVRRWSLRLDVKILLLTLVRGFVNENAF